ncbi:hypothetical protein OU798_17715 [Prolixibacteraceae bacterium Z1-6]|uniref:SbsA Ig-like domain-containing protein n=1 Tax=Draconibacterium aestuarii TaxID=2998507 RepID=A0A9X3F7Y4_9BACT|nr:hypothetical protein [Prolixibacteraceae bacterium Z1-6]
MKKIIYNITAVLFLGLLIASCEDWDKYESADLASAPEITLDLLSVKDSSVTVSAKTNVAGYVSMLITDDTTLTVEDIDAEQLLTGNESGLEKLLFNVGGAANVEYEFSSGLSQNKWYQVFVVASNEDGVFSAVEGKRVRTDDSHPPVLLSTSPSKSSEAAQENMFAVELTFSEPVQLTDAAKFSFSYYYDDEAIPAENVTVNDNVVTVSQVKEPYNGEWVFLSWEEGAVTDFQAGTPNKVAEQVSGVIDGGLAGLYWRVQHVAFDMAADNFMPEVGSAVSDPQFDIMYEFPYAVSFATDDDGYTVYEDGEINVTFWSEGKKTIIDVPFEYLTLTGGDSVLVVSIPEAAQYGNTVSVNIAEGVVVDGYGNPNATFESDNESGANWLISYGYTRDMIIGTYTFSGVSYWEGGDEAFNVEIVADPEDESKVIINGFYGSATPIPAIFNGDFATLTVQAEEDYLLGDLFADGGETYFWSYDEAEFVINILSNGDMVTDPYYWLALYWVAGDESDEGWVNIFVESTWTKTESVSASSGVKAARIVEKVIHSDLSRDGIIKTK